LEVAIVRPLVISGEANVVTARRAAGFGSVGNGCPVPLLVPHADRGLERIVGPSLPRLTQHGWMGTSALWARVGSTRPMDETFDPAGHRFGPSRYFEDFVLGEAFYIPSRTVTEAQFLAFQAASGDNHPIHYDREYCRRHGYPDLLAHGFQVLIQTAAGAGLFPFLVEDSLIGFIEQSSRFLKPVYVGDTLYPQLKVSELKPQRTTGVLALASTVHNQKRELVMEGVQRYLIRKRAS
jgi:acyl dehydratase